MISNRSGISRRRRTGGRAGSPRRPSSSASPTEPTAMDLPPPDDALYGLLRDDIRRRGIQVPILVDTATGEVIDGALRTRIAAELGIRQVPTIYVARLDPQERADL